MLVLRLAFFIRWVAIPAGNLVTDGAQLLLVPNWRIRDAVLTNDFSLKKEISTFRLQSTFSNLENQLLSLNSQYTLV